MANVFTMDLTKGILKNQKERIGRRLLRSNLPCLSCGSSDALAVYDNGSYCFSCKRYIYNIYTTHKNAYDPTDSLCSYFIGGGRLEDKITYQYLEHRSIHRNTYEYYGAQVKVNAEGSPIAIGFPYGSYTIVRDWNKKHYTTKGDASDFKLFGQEKFQAGSSKSITITEGAYDALSLYELLRYPVVSVRSASTARGDCERQWNYLNAFDKIYICMDADKPGEDAASEVASLFDVNKVYHVKLTKWKDANEALVQGHGDELKRCWWNAKKYQPKGIVSDYAAIEEILSKESAQAQASFPFPTLDSMAYGIREGELVLFTALEKVGKTEVLRALEYHLLKTTKENIGIIHLEEQEKRSVQGLVGYELRVPAHLPDAGVSTEDCIDAYKQLTGRDNRLFFYTHFGSEDPDNILSAIRYLVAVNKCKYIFLDHITMLVTGFEDEDERKRLDYISTRLAMMTRELNFTLFMVSHVNDLGQTRGSRNIAKVADLILHLERDIDTGSNWTKITCRGNRYAGITGPAGTLVFDPKTFTLKEQEVIDDKHLQFDPPQLAQSEVLELVSGVHSTSTGGQGYSTSLGV